MRSLKQEQEHYFQGIFKSQPALLHRVNWFSRFEIYNGKKQPHRPDFQVKPDRT